MIPFKSILKKIYHLLPTPPSTNFLYRAISPNPYDLLPAHALIFDIGSKDNKGLYAFGPPPKDAHLICVDIEERLGVDLVADAHNMPMVTDNSVDCVLCVSLLEHVRYPQKVMKEIFRILKPGGILYINVPFVFPFHADPDDFYRFSYKGIAILCEDFDCIDCGFNRGPASTMHHLLVHFMALLFCFNNKTIYGINIDIFKYIFFWVKYLDLFMARYELAYLIHAGSYYIGRKPHLP
ncbi:MAG: class I SAM-dependent methyltransferase [Magnetococcus sp. DMHC-6]